MCESVASRGVSSSSWKVRSSIARLSAKSEQNRKVGVVVRGRQRNRERLGELVGTHKTGQQQSNGRSNGQNREW